MERLKWSTVQRKVSDLVPLDYNPRILTEEKKAKLVASLEKFNLVEIPVINLDNNLVAGNQRVFVLMDLGRGDEIIDVRLPNRALTEAEVKEYNIVSNTHVGIWDVKVLEEVFGDLDLEGLGVDIPDIEVTQPEVDFSLKNKEIDIDDLDDEMKLVLNYSSSTYWKIKERLGELGMTPEGAFCDLLGIKEDIDEEE